MRLVTNCRVIWLISKPSQIDVLASLFNLLTVLICSVPPFLTSLLAVADNTSTPRAIVVLCDAIQGHGDPTMSSSDGKMDLLRELLVLWGVISFSTPDNFDKR
jgi:hypothetical protein